MPEARHFAIEFTDDAALAEALINHAAVEKKAGAAAPALPAGMNDVMCVVRVSYGLGARQGGEQLGFKKTYRPFVRLRSEIRRPGTGQVVWQGAVIAWGAKGYKAIAGGKVDAKAIPREELLEALKTASEDSVSLFLRSLDGESLKSMGVLVDETKEDSRF